MTSAAATSERLGARLFLHGVRLVAARELGAAFDTGIATIATPITRIRCERNVRIGRFSIMSVACNR